jgi:ABC-type branched-subunit amino acid transport system substrate-binding protein
VQIGAYKAVATFVRQARRGGFSGNFYNVSFVGTQALMDELGAEARGVSVSQVMPFPYTPATPLSGEYLAAIKEKRGVEPNYSGMEGFVAAKVFTEAVRRAGRALTREGFINAVQGMQNVNLGGFPVDFSAGKHTGSKFVELTLLTEDGRIRR